MCGRFTLAAASDAWAELFGLDAPPEWKPRYNIAPTQDVATVRTRPEGEGREFASLRWGLVPHWAKDARMGSRLINVRSETVAEKPAFRDAFRERRCLVVADGFYEWQPAGRRKQPYHIHLPGGEPFAFAGLWDLWRPRRRGGAGGSRVNGELETCTILTTDATEDLRPLHDRMPVILPPEAFDVWLDPASHRGELEPWLGRAPEDEPRVAKALNEELVATPVSTQVNSPDFDDPDCIRPLVR